MKFTDELLEQNLDLWEGYLKHPFVKGIAEGDLNIDHFRYYMIQDYIYLFDYVKVFSLGLVKCDSFEDQNLMSGSIAGVLWEVENVHKKYMERIGISEDEIENTPVHIDNTSYTKYMLYCGYEGDYFDILMAILSCVWSYHYIAEKINGKDPKAKEHEFYGQWISSYISDEFRSLKEGLVQRANELAKEVSKKQLEKAHKIFRNCSIYEMQFWEMAIKR